MNFYIMAVTASSHGSSGPFQRILIKHGNVLTQLLHPLLAKGVVLS
jgi:hypothetical protein